MADPAERRASYEDLLGLPEHLVEGVGIAAMRERASELGGTVEVKSVIGEGSSFLIKIPLTLAIVSALIVEAAGDRFANLKSDRRIIDRLAGVRPEIDDLMSHLAQIIG